MDVALVLKVLRTTFLLRLLSLRTLLLRLLTLIALIAVCGHFGLHSSDSEGTDPMYWFPLTRSKE